MRPLSPFAPGPAGLEQVARIRERWPAADLEVAIVGAGRSGRSAHRLCVARGVEAALLDDRPADPTIGRLTAEAVSGADLVVLSPGVPRRHPALADAVASGRVVGELELAAWLVEAPLIGVTGTNGKSTTTALIAHGLERAGHRVFAGGNLGRPLSELARSGEAVDYAVVEMSSYQLESLVDLRLAASVWLNLQPDHLDRYDSVESYALAKRRIVELTRRGGLAVLNADDPHCLAAAEVAECAVRWFARSPAEARPGTLVDAQGFGHRDGEERYRLSGSALPGRHNRENAAAAIEVWRWLGVLPELAQDAIDGFPGLAHRLERVPTTDGRAWLNDSKATNVAAAIVGIEAVAGRKLLIVGGRAKSEPFAPLVEAAVRCGVVRVLAIGESAGEWGRAFSGAITCDEVGTLERAVEVARTSEVPTVLFSPACASFDQFQSFEHRGEVFRRVVQEGAP